jgi:Ser/Thr protein kinase RdoA (MazF antagonist)
MDNLVYELYGIRGSAEPLPSERDQNFLITADTGEKFVLKIFNPEEWKTVAAAQNWVLKHLSQRVSFCQSVITGLSGRMLGCWKGQWVRLLTYLPGVPLAEIRPHTPGLLHDLGRKLGQLTSALADFDHYAVHRNFHWDLANGNRVVSEYAELVANNRLRELVLKCRVEHDSRLRRSVIHGDANDYNVLVDPESMTVSGLIDFGDMVYSYTVGDLAIAIAYAVLDKPDPFSAAEEIVAGYTSEFALLDSEREALWPLVRLRLAMSVCLAAHQRQQQPENEYLGISQQAIEETLPRICTDEYTD